MPAKPKPRQTFSKAEQRALETHEYFSRPDVKAKEAAAIKKLEGEILENKAAETRDYAREVMRRNAFKAAKNAPSKVTKTLLGEPRMQEFITRTHKASKFITSPELRTILRKRAGALSRFVRPIRRML